MKRFLIIIVLVILTLIALSPLLRAARPAPRDRSGPSSHRPTYHADHGPASSYRWAPSYKKPYRTTYPTNYAAKAVKFRHGVYYAGKAHCHWTKRSYSRSWGHWFFWSPADRGWFYYYAGGDRYYPVVMLTSAPPSTDVLPPPPPGPPAREKPAPEGSLEDVPPVPDSDAPDLPECPRE
jgi:hypothetical protein